MLLVSPAFSADPRIPVKYTCDGENVSPPLVVHEIPEKTNSLVLIVDDPDARQEGGWVHWVVFNISPQVHEVAENAVPEGGTEATTSFGKTGYGGPCPPSGLHRYLFKLFALDTKLELTQSATREDILKAMDGHIIDWTILVGTYERSE